MGLRGGEKAGDPLMPHQITCDECSYTVTVSDSERANYLIQKHRKENGGHVVRVRGR